MEKGSTLEQFLKDLAGNTLGRIEHVAMVKPDDGKSGGLLVAVQPGCERWIPLPAAVIDRVEYLETARCKDHTHPLVRLTLRMPPEDNPIAVLFAELLFQQTKSAALSASSSADLSVLPSAQFGALDRAAAGRRVPARDRGTLSALAGWGLPGGVPAGGLQLGGPTLWPVTPDFALDLGHAGGRCLLHLRPRVHRGEYGLCHLQLLPHHRQGDDQLRIPLRPTG